MHLNPSISVIVPTIGRPEALEALLVSLANQTRVPDEIIIADGSSTNAIRELTHNDRWAASGLSVNHISVNPPNAVSQRQAAIAKSHGNLLLFLDDDVVLEPACTQELEATLLSQEEIVAVVADFNNQSWSKPTVLWRWYLRIVLGLSEHEAQGRVVGPLLRFGFYETPSVPTPMEWIATCNSMVRKDAYVRAGGFSDFFLHRCTMNEDLDLGLKLSREGKIMFCPAARLAHHHAPGGRVGVDSVAEDDVYNRFKVLHHTIGKTAAVALWLVVQFVLVETLSNVLGAVRRFRAPGLAKRTKGRVRALRKIVSESL